MQVMFKEAMTQDMQLEVFLQPLQYTQQMLEIIR